MASLGDLMLRVGVDLSAFNTAMSEIGPKVQAAASDAEKAWAPLQTLGTSMMGIGAGLSAAITAPLVALGAAAVSTSEQLNLARMSFTTMLGDGQKADQFLRSLADFAAKTPFEFPDLVQAARKMQAMGFESEKVLPTLRSIGDAAAALGGGKQFIDGVTTALGQMQAKGKVSAEEMNQLAERGVPAWKFLADQIGVKIPDAMKLAEQGAIQASVAIPAILQGMNQKFGGQMAQASETLTGKWSNFKDQVTMTLTDLGNTLSPVLSKLLDLMNPILEWAKSAAQWFAQLPSPVQNAALAFGALLAAAGPIALAIGGIATAIGTLMPLLAPIGAAIGIGTGALLGWVAAIPLAIAALVALGTWVYDNWDAIKSVIFTAWDGVQEMWAGFWGPIGDWIKGVWLGIANSVEPIFGPIRDFFGKVWDGIAALWSGVWDGIKGALSFVWEAIKKSASDVWLGIVSVFQTFLEWAQKIPGVNKLMNLDDAWNSAKKLSEETKKAADQTKNLHDKAKAAADGNNKPLPKLALALGDTAKKAKDAADEFKPLSDKGEILKETARKLNEEHKKHVETLVALKLKLDDAKASTAQMIQPSEDLNATVQRIAASAVNAKDQFGFFGDAVQREMNESLKPIRDVEDAFKTLGINSTAHLNDTANNAKIAYETIKNSGTATATDLDRAWVAYEEARIAAAKAMGQSIPQETQDALDKVKEKLEGKQGKSAWSDWSKQVSTIITDLGKNISDALWDGESSWGEKGMKILKSLGESVTRAFVEPATKAIGDLISGAIADLIGGKGFGGVLDRVKDLGSAIGGVFGGGSSAAGAAGSAGGSIPSTGGAGAAAGGLGGVAGAVNVVSGVVGAVASIGNLIVGMKQEGTMNQMERNTAAASIHLSYILENSNTYWPYLEQIHRSLLEFRGDLVWMVSEINDRSRFALDHLGEIARNTANKTTSIVINVSGAQGPEATGRAIAAALRTQMA